MFEKVWFGKRKKEKEGKKHMKRMGQIMLVPLFEFNGLVGLHSSLRTILKDDILKRIL